MSFLQREFERLNKAYYESLENPERDETRHRELYAAQQAISFAMEPTGIRAPSDMILGVPVSAEGVQPQSVHA